MVLAISLAFAPFNPGPPSVAIASYRFVGGRFGRKGKASAGVRENGWLVGGRIGRAGWLVGERIGRAGRIEGRIGDTRSVTCW